MVDLAENNESEVYLSKRISEWFIRQGLRGFMSVYSVSMIFGKLIGRYSKWFVNDNGFDILLTGNFYSDNWVMSHLRPLVMSRHVSRLRVVSVYQVPSLDKMEIIYPPAWLVRFIGPTPARLLIFVWMGFHTRPHIVGGYHLLMNGLAAALLARLIGARSLYNSCAGPQEVIGGGYLNSETKLFSKLRSPDRILERQLIRAVAYSDLVITRGSRANTFFRQHGVKTRIHIVTGGIDGSRFYPSDSPPNTDLILVGRLGSVKRVDIFLQAVKKVCDVLPGVTAVIIGGGPKRNSLEQLAKRLGIEQNVSFVGHKRHVEKWLRQSKIFVLTSDSEGLSLAMIEAMLCGLPAIVSNVGDLGAIVENGVNGYLVDRRVPEAFSERIVTLLKDPDRQVRFGLAAHQSAKKYEISMVSQLWDEVFESIRKDIKISSRGLN